MEHRQLFVIKLFITVLICALFYTSFSRYGVIAYERVFLQDQFYAEGTFIGPVDVSGLQANEAVKKIEDSIKEWQSANTMTLSYADKSIPIPTKNIRFDIAESVQAAQSGMPVPLLTFVKEHVIRKQLRTIFDESMIEKMELKKLQADLQNRAGTLPENPVIKLRDFMYKDTVSMNEVLSQIEITVPLNKQQSTWLKEQGKILIPKKANFSLLNLVKDENPTLFTNEDLSMLASGLYEATLPTNLQIVERHTSKVLPEGYTVGYEAKIRKEKMDFVIHNPNDYDMTIRFKEERENIVSITVSGMATGFTYNIRFENEQTYEPKQIVQYVPSLETVENTQSQVGKAGYSVSVYRDVYNSEGERRDSSLIAEDFYLPVNEIIIKEIISPKPIVDELEDEQDNEMDEEDQETDEGNEEDSRNGDDPDNEGQNPNEVSQNGENADAKTENEGIKEMG